MPFVAQTNLQLYNQLRREARSDDDMRLVRAAYELAVTHYSGYFGGDRKPFVAHTIGVASILASLGQPALMIAAGLLHNVYGNGDFGDGLHNAATARRRRLVRTAVGGAVEDVLYRFHTCRVRLDPDEGYRQRLARLAQLDNEVLLLDLADVVEKHVDSSVLYHGNGSWISDPIGRHDAFLVDIARRIGQPALAVMLERQFAEVAADPGLPHALRAPPGAQVPGTGGSAVVPSPPLSDPVDWRAMVGTPGWLGANVQTLRQAHCGTGARLNSPAHGVIQTGA